MAVPFLSLVVGISFVAFTTYRYLLYPAFLSPLAKIPNAHWSSAISSFWILWMRFTGENNATTYRRHRQYGPIVRLAPNEVSVNCVDGGLRTVYAGGMDKHRWYPDQFVAYGMTSMFSTTGHRGHSIRKRMMSNVYSKSFLQSSSQVAENSLVLLRDRFLPFLYQAALQGTAVDVHDMNNGFTMDFMSAYLFGIGTSTNFTLDPAARKHFLSVYHSRRPFEFYAQEIPRLVQLARGLGLRIIPTFVDQANQEIEAWAIEMCDAANSYLDCVPSPGFEPVAYKQLKTSMEQNCRDLKDPASADRIRLEIASEMLDQLGAGHETSAIALTYLYWEMSRHPDQQRRLRDELLTLEPPVGVLLGEDGHPKLPSPRCLDSLPFLDAVMMETLRLHAPIPGIEPRITPLGGCTLAGYANIPANVRVSAMAYALHRDESVFPEPEIWNVDRWLQPEGSAGTKEMSRWFWAFGSGGRMCLGKNLAMQGIFPTINIITMLTLAGPYQELKLIVAAIYSNFTTKIVNDDGIEAIDAYTTRPRSNQLILSFHPV